MKKIHLRKSPITEALIDINVTPGSGVNAKTLELLHEKIRADFPTKRTMSRFQVSFGQKEGDLGAATNFDAVGYSFFSQDERQVVQYRLNGFTFSRLKPYETWEKLRDTARKLWQIYCEGCKIESLNRLALRYVDLLEIPVGLPISDFIKNPPKAIKGGPSNLTAFLNQQRLLEPSTGVETLLTLSLAPPPNAVKLPLIIDTEIFKFFSSPLSEKDLWGLLEKFRVLKNNIFFGIITEKAVEEYR